MPDDMLGSSTLVRLLDSRAGEQVSAQPGAAAFRDRGCWRTSAAMVAGSGPKSSGGRISEPKVLLDGFNHRTHLGNRQPFRPAVYMRSWEC